VIDRRQMLLGTLATTLSSFYMLSLDQEWQHVLDPSYKFAYKLGDGKYIQAPGIKEIITKDDAHCIVAETLVVKTVCCTSGGMLLDSKGNVIKEFNFAYYKMLQHGDQLNLNYTLHGTQGLSLEECVDIIKSRG
jgi:hypothetical protein